MFEANPPLPKSDINLYFDIISPYSYFAFLVAEHYAHAWRSQGYAIHYIPVYQAGIMHGSHNTPGFLVPAKGNYSHLDIRRWSKTLGVSLETPSSFPANSIHCARVLAVIKRYHAMKLPAAMNALWQHTWTLRGDRLDLSSPADLSTILSRVFTGSEVEIMMKLSRSEHFKYVVKENTKKVVKDGCFGCPWIEVVKESGEIDYFYGNDRWPQVAEFAGLSWNGYAVVKGGDKARI